MAETTIYLGNKNYSSWSLRGWLALSRPEFPSRKWSSASTRTIRRKDPAAFALGQGAVSRARRKGDLGIAGHRRVSRRAVSGREALADRSRGTHPCTLRFERDACRLPEDAAEHADGYARRPGKEEPVSIPEVARDVRRIMAIWRECRERYGSRGAHGDGPFLYGGFSIADAMFAPVTTRFLTYGVPMDETCEAYVDAVRTWPAMAEWGRDSKREEWTLSYPVLDTPLA